MRRHPFQPPKQNKGPWWDPSAILQERSPLTALQIARLPEPSRVPSQIWKIPALSQRILSLYDAVMDTIETMSEDETIPWNNPSMRRYLHETAKGLHPSNPYDYTILTSLLRVVENRVRREVANTGTLNTKKDEEAMYRRLPRPILDAVWNVIETMPLSPLTKQDIPLLPAKETLAYHLLEEIMASSLTTEEILEMLNGNTHGFALRLLSKKPIAQRQDPDLLLLRTVLSWRNRTQYKLGNLRNAFRNHILPERFDDLLDILERSMRTLPLSDTWATDLLQEVKALQYPTVKKLHLSKEKIEASRRNLDATVELVDTFLEGAPESAPPADERKREGRRSLEALPEALSDPERGDASELSTPVPRTLLREVSDTLLDGMVRQGSLSRSEVEEIAQTVGKQGALLVSEINARYYDEIGAQLLVWEGERLTMDPLDADWWRERSMQ